MAEKLRILISVAGAIAGGAVGRSAFDAGWALGIVFAIVGATVAVIGTELIVRNLARRSDQGAAG
jgi:uncharacterized protein (DUF697 family)